jgi:IMP dehydrogenase/GMP reductase
MRRGWRRHRLFARGGRGGSGFMLRRAGTEEAHDEDRKGNNGEFFHIVIGMFTETDSPQVTSADVLGADFVDLLPENRRPI